jgi:hypothetical protein
MQSGAETDQFTSQAEERATYKPSKFGVSCEHARTHTDNVQTHRDDVPPLFFEARRREFNDGREAKLSPFSKQVKNNRTKRKTTKRQREERERNEDDKY